MIARFRLEFEGHGTAERSIEFDAGERKLDGLDDEQRKRVAFLIGEALFSALAHQDRDMLTSMVDESLFDGGDDA